MTDNNISSNSIGNKIKVNLYAFITVLLWGSSFPFTRMIGDQISAYSLALIRCLLAAIVLLMIGKACHIRKPFCKKDLLWFFISGICGFSLYSIFFNLGMSTLTSATGSIITAASPILTAIAVFKLYNERINLTGWISIICAFAGVVILIPVSYTHLDVYKRQKVYRNNSLRSLPFFLIFFKSFFQCLRTHIPRLIVAVYEYRYSVFIDNGIRRC